MEGSPDNMASNSINWEENARQMQQEFHDRLGDADWCRYKACELEYLQRNIGFAVFGEPTEEPNEDNLMTGYTKQQLKEIISLCEKIQEKDKHDISKARNMFNAIERLIFGDPDEVSDSTLTTRAASDTRSDNIIEIIKLMVNKKKGPYSLTLLVHNAMRNSQRKSRESVEDICNKIEVIVALETSVTWLSVIFVILKIEINEMVEVKENGKVQKKFTGVKKEVPVPEAVFRVPLESSSGVESYIFIDRNQRVYESWDKYLKNNKLPDCTYCYPTAGVYRGDELGNVRLEFGQTPAGSTANKVVDAADKVGIAASIGTTVVFGAALVTIPVAAPLMVGAAVVGGVVGLWGIGRGVENLVDRGLHEQSINVTNTEARNAWIGIGASGLGLAAAGATTALSAFTRSGMVIGETGQLLVNATQISALAANGIGIVNGAVNMHEKYKSDSLTALDVFQFSSSVLFFTSSVANLRMANTIIKETQATVIDDYRASLRSNRHRKGFDKVVRNTRAGDVGVEKNAKVIRGIKSIDSRDDFFSGVVRMEKHHKQNAKMTFTDTGNVDVNGRMEVNPSRFAGMPKAERIKLLAASKKFNDGSLNKAQFDLIVKNTYKPDLPASAKSVITPAVNNVRVISKPAEFDVKPFSFLSPRNMDIIKNLAKQTLAPLIIPLSKELFSKLIGAVLNEELFVKFMEFSYTLIKEMVDEMERAYQSALKVAMLYTNFDQTDFDKKYGEDRNKYFVECVRSILSASKKALEIIENFNEYCKSPDLLISSTTTDGNRERNVNNHDGAFSRKSFDQPHKTSEGPACLRHPLENSPEPTIQCVPLNSTDSVLQFPDLLEQVALLSSEHSLKTSTHGAPPPSELPSPLSAESSESPPPRPSNLLRATSHTYPWDFSTNEDPTDEDIYNITAGLSCMEVNQSLVDVRRYPNRIVVNFIEIDITVTVKMDKTIGIISAHIKHDN